MTDFSRLSTRELLDLRREHDKPEFHPAADPEKEKWMSALYDEIHRRFETPTNT